MIKAYSSYFVSYLLSELGDINIRKIILFGSVAMDNADKESDVDIFIEVKKNSLKFKKDIEKILNKFYKSREALIFKNKGIDNKINILIGKLADWRDLKKSIESTGIVLYGRFVSSGFSEGKKYLLISWDKIGKNRGAFLNKVYGFRVGEKRYKGLIETLSGRKIGKSSLMIPVENKDEIFVLIKKYDVDARLVEIYL